MDGPSTASEIPLFIEIDPNFLYSRNWMIATIPGMHKGRIQRLERSFGLLPLNSGNKESPFIYRGLSIIEAMEREALHRRGDADTESEVE